MSWQDLVQMTQEATDRHLLKWETTLVGYLTQLPDGLWIIVRSRSFSYGSNKSGCSETIKDDDSIAELFISIQNPKFTVMDAVARELDKVLAEH